jgi:hypothetical protein
MFLSPTLSHLKTQEAHEAQLADLKKRFKKISDDVAPW